MWVVVDMHVRPFLYAEGMYEQHARNIADFLNTGATAADAALGRQVREAAAALGVDVITDAIYQTLIGYRCVFTQIEDDGGAMPLIDLLSPGSASIAVGKEECSELAWVIAAAILARMSPAPAPAEGEGIPPTGPARGSQTMLTVGGSPFKCQCGCNVFTRIGTDKYRCNGCQSEYEEDLPTPDAAPAGEGE